MTKSESQKRARDKWDSVNMVYQTVKVRRALLDDFKAACAARGDRVNTVLRKAMEDYIDQNQQQGPPDHPEEENT